MPGADEHIQIKKDREKFNLSFFYDQV